MKSFRYNYPLPNFLLIGTAKSGTSTLYNDLRSSCDINLPEVKEPAILCRARNLEKARGLYQKHFFSNIKSSIDTCRGDGSTYYTMQPLFPDVSKFAYELCGKQLKILVILRNPIDRIVSHVNHDYAVGRINYHNFEEAFSSDSRYLDFSDYYKQLENWYRYFDKSSIKCINFEHYINNRKSTIEDIANFLEVKIIKEINTSQIKNTNSNLKSSKVPNEFMFFYNIHLRKYISPSLREALKSIFAKRENKERLNPSDNTIAKISLHFKDLEKNLESLTGNKINFHSTEKHK